MYDTHHVGVGSRISRGDESATTPQRIAGEVRHDTTGCPRSCDASSEVDVAFHWAIGDLGGSAPRGDPRDGKGRLWNATVELATALGPRLETPATGTAVGRWKRSVVANGGSRELPGKTRG